MFSRDFTPPAEQTYFLFWPRGTGKSVFVEGFYKHGLFFDLLEARVFNEFVADPSRLSLRIPEGFADWVVIDEIQKVPALLDEVHRLIQKRGLRFVLTSSSARRLKRANVNLLGGRALTCRMYPLTAKELGGDFDLARSLRYGHLPAACTAGNPVLSYEIPAFTKRAKRDVMRSVKFYFFDAGVFRAIRPAGPYDSDSETGGAALETLVLQKIAAQNDYENYDYKIYYWRTRQGTEVDFILYGKRGFKAIEVKHSARARREDFKGLR